MQITNEMVEAALDAYDAPRYATCEKRMRAALEAALGEKKEYQSENGIIFRLRKRNVPYGWIELADIAAACIEELAAALKLITPPLRGVCGGPLVCAKAIYEDGTDENTKRHKGSISPEDYRRACSTLERWGLK